MGWIERIRAKRRDREEIKRKDEVIQACMKNLGVERFQKFCFKNQINKKERYYFSYTMLVKENGWGDLQESHIRFNFLLDGAKALIIVTDEFAEG